MEQKLSGKVMHILLDKIIASKSKQQVIKTYGGKFWDYIYEEIGGKQLDLWIDFMRMFTENIEFGNTVLDLGCGFGIESILLSTSCKKIIGLDPDKGKIRIFNKLIRDVSAHNIATSIGYGEDIPFKAKTFDSVFCNESLSHVKDIKKTLSEIKRVLKKGGKLIVADTKRWNPYGIYMIYIRRDFEENYYNTWTMKTLLKESGFNNIKRVKYITCPRDPFKQYVKQLWPILKLIDPKYVFIGSR